jgi:hypothetical protein
VNKTLVKPEPNAAGQYQYLAFIRYLEQKYGFKSEGSGQEDSHFDKWADARGYTAHKRDPEGKDRLSSQIWYTEYQNDPHGAAAAPKKKSFHRWLCWLGNAFLSSEQPEKPLTLNMGLMLDRWNDIAAPVFQKAVDLARMRVVNHIGEVMEAEKLPGEYQARVLRQYLEPLPEDARLPDYVRTILEYAQKEFGDWPVVYFGEERDCAD